VIIGHHGTLFRELKRQGEYPTIPQNLCLQGLARTGMNAGVWRPSDLLSGRIAQEIADLNHPPNPSQVTLITHQDRACTARRTPHTPGTWVNRGPYGWECTVCWALQPNT
jgi:hypothetical protein